MTEQPAETTQTTAETSARRPGSMLVVGSVLWVLCLLAIFYCWNELRLRRLTSTAESKTNSANFGDDEGDGRNTKALTLVPQKDGSFAVKEVTGSTDESPWDADGIEDFSFTDSSGQTLTKNDLIGKPFVISFVFTQCRGPCPNVTLQMRALQDRLKDLDFNLVTLTVDPDRDTVETLSRYGKDHGANFDRWKFLTGKQSDIYGLIQRGFKMPVEETKGKDRVPGFEIIHSTNIMLVNSSGRVVGKFNAQKDEDMARLRKELKQMAKPKANASDVIDLEGTR